MFRSILGILAGYALFAATTALLFRITNHNPHAPVSHGFALFSIVYGMVFAGVGGYLAGIIANRREFIHGCVVGVLIALGAIVSLIARPPGAAIWSQLSALLLMTPMAAVGGFVSAIRAKATPAPNTPP